MGPSDSLIGQVIGNYEILRELGRGGMGVVYKAHEQSLQRVVALKVLPKHLAEDAAFVKRFVREARAAARLNHPNIVMVHAVGQHQGMYYIAMQYVKGQSLAEVIREEGQLDVRKALDITRQAAEALAESHKQGIIHRDVKPQNVMLDQAGRVKVMDFGLARAAQSSTQLTADGAKLGTPMYMSPEQCMGKQLDARTDIYSLGVTLYEMVAGRPPFKADTPLALMYQITHEPMPPVEELNSEAPPIAAQVIADMVARDPEQRYPSTEILCKHLDAMLRGEAPAPLAQIPVPKRRPQPKRQTAAVRRPEPPIQSQPGAQMAPRRYPRKLVIGLGFAVALGVLLAVGTVAFWNQSGESPSEEWISLFNGEDYSGWEGVDDPLRPIAWRVQDGAMIARSETKYIRTLEEWGDFELEFEYRTTPGSNGGVVLRGKAHLQVVGPEGDPKSAWGACSIFGQHHPLVNTSKSNGEWNQVRVEVVGDTLTAYLNDLRIHDAVKLTEQEGESYLPGPVTAPGPIVLESFLDTVAYRNMRIRPIEMNVRGRPTSQALPESPSPGGTRTVELGKGAKLEMVWIPPGEFMMGSPVGEPDRNDDDETQHEVTITRGFWMGKYEVTQRQWRAVMGNNPSHYQGSVDMPVDSATWDDSQDFVQKMNAVADVTFRLPTEAEWEYACRAGTTTPFHFGEGISTDQANYDGNYTYADGVKGKKRGNPIRVGTFAPNAWGLHDMHGNVSEWCQDWYGEEYYWDSPERDPQGPSSGEGHVLRGGAWLCFPCHCRSAIRARLTPDSPPNCYGFRVVCAGN